MSLPTNGKVTTVAETKWLRLETVDWVDHEGRERKWDRVVRSTTIKEGATDAATVCGLKLIEPGSKKLGVVFVIQYRPPLGKFCLEFPAGLLDADGETIEECGTRELQEETGFHGEVVFTAPRVSLSPGLGKETTQFIVTWIDAEKSENLNPVPHFDAGEDCETVVLPLDNLLESMQRLCRERDLEIYDGCYAFALGLQIGLHGRELTKSDLASILI